MSVDLSDIYDLSDVENEIKKDAELNEQLYHSVLLQKDYLYLICLNFTVPELFTKVQLISKHHYDFINNSQTYSNNLIKNCFNYDFDIELIPFLPISINDNDNDSDLFQTSVTTDETQTQTYETSSNSVSKQFLQTFYTDWKSLSRKMTSIATFIITNFDSNIDIRVLFLFNRLNGIKYWLPKVILILSILLSV